jgi:hypothetical protein
VESDDPGEGSWHCFGRWSRGQAATLSGAQVHLWSEGLGSEADIDSTRIRSPVGVPQVSILITVEALDSVLIAQSSIGPATGAKPPSVKVLAPPFSVMRVHSIIR